MSGQAALRLRCLRMTMEGCLVIEAQAVCYGLLVGVVYRLASSLTCSSCAKKTRSVHIIRSACSGDTRQPGEA